MQLFLQGRYAHGRHQSYNYPSLRTILLFSKMNWVKCNDRFNLGSVVEHNSTNNMHTAVFDANF